MTKKFGAIVIGSGIGGLTAARLLSMFGRKRVLVLEQHTTLGGLTHVFSRPISGSANAAPYEFATGVHYLGRTADLASIQAVLAQLTEDRVQWRSLPDPFDIFHFPNWSFAVPDDEATYKTRLIERFPQERAAIDGYFRDVRRAAKGIATISFVNGLPPPVQPFGRWLVRKLFPLAFERTQTYFDRKFSSPALKALLGAQWGDYGRQPSATAFGIHANVVVHFLRGAMYPLGGPARISEPIIEILRRDGSEVRAGQLVREILIENERAVGVRVEDLRAHETYDVRAPVVVSDAGVNNTFGSLLPETHRGRFAAELASLTNGPSALVLFLGLKASPATLGLTGAGHWIFPSENHDAAMAAPPGEGAIYISFPSLKNPAAPNHTVEVVSLIEPEAFRAWAGEPWPRQAPDYVALKRRLIERLLARIETQMPGFRGLVDFAELATPLTFNTFQRSVQGAFYGLDSTPERVLSPLTATVTRIPGLFLAGQDACSPGIIAAMVGGFLAALAALPFRERGRMFSKFSLTRASKRSPDDRPADFVWKGYLKVTEIVQETPTVKSLRLENPDGGALPFAFTPGQFLTLSLPVAGGAVRRNYSIASSAVETGSCTITVKRETYGLGSRHLHDDVAIGRCLQVEGPFGRFTLDDGASDTSVAPVVLIAGGVGITPLMSILRQLQATRSRRRIMLLACFRAPEEIIFHKELIEIARNMPNLTLRILVEQPDTAWAGEIGRPTKVSIAVSTGSYLGQARVHLCGPKPMMDTVIAMLTELGISSEHIQIENFTAVDDGESGARDRAIRAAAVAGGTVIPTLHIHFRSSARTAGAKLGQSLLDAALAEGVPIKHACKAGICAECRIRVERGTFETEDPNNVLTEQERQSGYVLACRTYPTSDVELAA